MKEEQDFRHGIEWMDFQHQQLIDKFNELHDTCSSTGCSTNRPSIDETITFIEHYISEHFGLEELYMKKSTYPDYKKHEREHLMFSNDFRQLRHRITEKGAVKPDELVSKLANWIINHIANSDRLLAAYLLKKPIR